MLNEYCFRFYIYSGRRLAICSGLELRIVYSSVLVVVVVVSKLQIAALNMVMVVILFRHL